MYTYKLTIAYDGTSYSGWQMQSNASSIQQYIQKALTICLRKDKAVDIIGSGRTDAGVHAIAQIAHFKCEKSLDLNRFVFSLNGLLPRDIRIKKAELASDNFHARYSSIGKEYHYHLCLDRVVDPFRRLYCWHIYKPLDKELLRKAARSFIGTHDFTSFANEAHTGSAAHNPFRTLYRLDICDTEEGLRLEFEGDGFLYRMVRNIVGTLVEIASHRRFLEEIPIMFTAKDRRQSGKGAPPQGLFLVRVDYPPDHLI
jgi:tRNA pseudouridine38-40 synthase